MRLFTAITLPEEVQDQLAGLANGLPGARWVNADRLHLTLRFLGELDGAQAADVDTALTEIHLPGFELELAGVSHFGDSRKLRSLWVGAEPNPLLTRLQAKIETAVVRAGLAPERRKFKAHVTLARFKSSPGDHLQAFLAQHALFRLPPFPVTSFTLYSSFLAHEGAIYRAEADYPLERPELVVGAEI